MKTLRFIITTLLLTYTSTFFAQIDITNLSGGVITAQHSDSPTNEGIEKLIDNLTTTKYLTFNASAWVMYKSPSPYVLSKYTLTSANDAPERDPLNWILEGSNNGVTFFTLDTQNNQDFPSRQQKRIFDINEHSSAYIYYRLSMQNNSGSILQLAEIELIGIEGSISTEPFADFSTQSYLVTSLPILFNDASLNTSTRNWTFEGGTPNMSTEINPKVVFENPGEFTITLAATEGDVTVTKSTKITIKDINDWSSFVYPTINLTSVNTSNPGYLKYTNLAKMKGFDSIEDFVANCCLVIAKELYYTVNEANEQNLQTINYKLNEGGHLSYKSGSAPTIEIGFDMNYLNSFSQNHADEVSADEIYGVLCHEICHGYQRNPRNAGGYASGTEHFAFIEGTADLARLLTGGFNPIRYPRVGGNWTDGYNTTAFFYQWITNTRSATFLKDINRTALTINPWSLNAATSELLGETAQSLWNKYQLAIPTLSIDNKKENRVTIAINQTKTELSINNSTFNDSISVYDLRGNLVLKTTSAGIRHTVNIQHLPKGGYILRIGDYQKPRSIKFLK